MILRINSAVTAANGAPSGATAGIALALLNADDATVLLQSVAGDAAAAHSVASAKLWLYYDGPVHNDQTDGSQEQVGVWAPAGTDATAASEKGLLNEGAALGETGTDVIRHAERVFGLRDASRIYIEYGAFAGANLAMSAYLVRRGGAR
jgi:hypothetical protein